MEKYKYKLKEQQPVSDIDLFHEKRINIFNQLENRLLDIKKLLRKAKTETMIYYKSNPESYSVVYGTDMIDDYFNDIETLLGKNE
jgi:hypothetical protein